MNQFQSIDTNHRCMWFCWFREAKALSKTDSLVIGIDNMNSYYDVNLKRKKVRKYNKGI